MPAPVLLIHGCGGSWTDWQGSWITGANVIIDAQSTTTGERSTLLGAHWTLLQAVAAGRQPATAPNVYLIDYSGATSEVTDLALMIPAAIDVIGQPVTIIAHSMGGILARVYVQGLANQGPANPPLEYRDDVVGLYTIATDRKSVV